MRFAVISDVHGNRSALDSVLKDIHRRKFREIHFAGDAVGYGPDPEACVDGIKEHCPVSVAGNHDQALTGQTPYDTFNERAREAIIWSRKEVSQKNMKYLEALPLKRTIPALRSMIVHSSPKDPGAWHYLYSVDDIMDSFAHFTEKICFVGHSHVPFIAVKDRKGSIQLLRESARIEKYKRYIINAGSVGQPRDGDPRACYICVRDDRIDIIRVEYDIELTQMKIYEAGLPRRLGERLSRGF